MFHQNFIPWKSKSPVTFWITGVLCDCSQKKTLPFGDVFFRGCPDGTPYEKSPIMEYLRM